MYRKETHFYFHSFIHQHWSIRCQWGMTFWPTRSSHVKVMYSGTDIYSVIKESTNLYSVFVVYYDVQVLSSALKSFLIFFLIVCIFLIRWNNSSRWFCQSRFLLWCTGTKWRLAPYRVSKHELRFVMEKQFKVICLFSQTPNYLTTRECVK